MEEHQKLPRKFQWWHFGVVGGVALVCVSLLKVVRVLFRPDSQDQILSLPLLLAGIFVAGFVCGVFIWAVLPFAGRGKLGLAVIGFLVMHAFLLGCFLVFAPRPLSMNPLDYYPITILAVLFGPWAGIYMGKEYLEAREKERKWQEYQLWCKKNNINDPS